MKQTQQEPAKTDPPFIPNNEYIECLIRNSVLSKTDTKSALYKANWERLTEMELSMSSYEIIKNTSIAFSK